MPRLQDYTIDHRGVAWAEVLRPWAWLLPREFTVWIVNRFGDLFIVLDDGSIHLLDVGVGSLEKLAGDREDFARLIDDDDKANDWLMMPLVDQLVALGRTLGPGECYSYVQLPLLGGDYTPENTRIVPIADHYKALGPIHERLKDLPDGTAVELIVSE